jgi:hypothetical protein
VRVDAIVEVISGSKENVFNHTIRDREQDGSYGAIFLTRIWEIRILAWTRTWCSSGFRHFAEWAIGSALTDQNQDLADGDLPSKDNASGCKFLLIILPHRCPYGRIL